MRLFYFIGFLIVLAFDTLAQISFKLAGMDTHPGCDLAWIMRVIHNIWTYGAVLGYIGAFLTWMTLLKRAPIGPAFAATHLYVVTVAIFSYFFFGERLTMLQILGSLFIVAGIIVLACGKEKEEQPAIAVGS